MEAISASSLPPGFGFHPTDVELISHYLKRKILGHKMEVDVIPEVDIYKHEPWDLPAKSRMPTRDCKWHFFTSRDRKYPNGSRSNRATEAGYWKSTGKDRNIRFNSRIIGTKKTLVFHEGKPPHGKRTDWIMHEYYLNENEYKTMHKKDIFVLCRVTKRNGLTKEDEEMLSTQVENNISSCAPLPSTTCLKDLQDVCVHLMPKNEVGSPVENVDYEAWFMELYDPNFITDPLSEPISENKVGTGSLNLKDGLEEEQFLLNNIVETDVSIPEHGISGVLGHQFNAYEFDDSLFGLSNSEDGNAIYTHQLVPEFGVDYPSYPGYGTICTEDDVLMHLPTSTGLLTDYQRVIPQGEEESIASLVSNLSGHQDIVGTGIQIREGDHKYSNEIPRHQHRIRLQVHKMESRNPRPINQTFVFVSEDNHLDLTCQLNQDSSPFDTKSDSDMSGAFAVLNKQRRTETQEKLTCESSSPALFSKHDTESQERISQNNEPKDPPPQLDENLGSVYATMLSMLRRRKLVVPWNPSKISLKSRGSVSKSSGFLRGICPLLHKLSLAGLNCLFMATCMIGTATLITFFLVRDARRFVCSSHIFDL